MQRSTCSAVRQEIERDDTHYCYLRGASRTVPRNRCGRATEHTTETAFAVEVLHDIEYALVLRAALALSLDLVRVVV